MSGDEPEKEKMNDRNLVTLTFRLEGGVKELLDEFTTKQRLPRSVVIRYSIERLLKEEPEYEDVYVPPGYGKPVVVSFKIDKEMKEKLENYAKSRRASRSEVIRYAVIRLLKEEGVLG
jgi:predicted transcriptional regulator